MNEPLFPEFALEPAPRPVTLTKTQKQFHTLVKKIALLKDELALWNDTIPREARMLRAEYDPLRDEYNTLRVELVQLLDRACADKRVTKSEKKKLRHLIPQITAELMQEQPGELVKSIHDRYSDAGFDAEDQAAAEAAKAMMEEMFGVELGDDIDLDDPEQLRKVAEKIAQDQYDQHEEQQRRSEAQRATRKKTAKQIEKEQKLQAEAAQARKSLQDVFRKLAAALHPDRAPDDAERERRTGLMQRANVAYEKSDLLQLLELQLEVEQVDQTHIETLPDERVKHYIKVLKEQCDELRDAINEAQLPFLFQFNMSPYQTLKPDVVVERLNYELEDMRSRVNILRDDLLRLAETTQLKQWLRDYRIPKEPDIDELFDFGFEPPFRGR